MICALLATDLKSVTMTAFSENKPVRKGGREPGVRARGDVLPSMDDDVAHGAHMHPLPLQVPLVPEKSIDVSTSDVAAPDWEGDLLGIGVFEEDIPTEGACACPEAQAVPSWPQAHGVAHGNKLLSTPCLQGQNCRACWGP